MPGAYCSRSESRGCWLLLEKLDMLKCDRIGSMAVKQYVVNVFDWLRPRTSHGLSRQWMVIALSANKTVVLEARRLIPGSFSARSFTPLRGQPSSLPGYQCL